MKEGFVHIMKTVRRQFVLTSEIDRRLRLYAVELDSDRSSVVVTALQFYFTSGQAEADLKASTEKVAS